HRPDKMNVSTPSSTSSRHTYHRPSHAAATDAAQSRIRIPEGDRRTSRTRSQALVGEPRAAHLYRAVHLLHARPVRGDEDRVDRGPARPHSTDRVVDRITRGASSAHEALSIWLLPRGVRRIPGNCGGALTRGRVAALRRGHEAR